MEVISIEFTARQLEIVELIKKNEPITSEQIADHLGVSKATLRSDLAVLVMTGYLDAKPKVGYFLGKSINNPRILSNELKELKVRDILSVPIAISESTTVRDAVITLFTENVGSLLVVNQEGHLDGIVSRKDLLKVTLGNASAPTMPVNLVMTRHPNIVTITPEESVIEAARKMIHYEVDSLPVVSGPDSPGDGDTLMKQTVVGRVTKTTITRVLLELATEA